MNNSKTKTKQYIDKNSIEAMRDSNNLTAAVAESFKQDVIAGMAADFRQQFLGFKRSEKNTPEAKMQGDLVEGQEISIANLQKAKLAKEERVKPRVEAGIDYTREILHGEKGIQQRQNQEIKFSIQEILAELRKLAGSSKQLEVKFKEVTVEQRITKPGKYHLSLFQWILAVVKQARLKIEDSKFWLATAKTKHAKKGIYWTNADEKVGGTSYSLSSERVVATQTG